MTYAAMETKGRKNFLQPLAPLQAARAPWLSTRLGGWEVGSDKYHLDQFLFVGPRGGGDYLRVGLFAGIHGDEIAGIHAAVRFLQELAAHPELARGYEVYVYPLCNPTGYEDGTRHSRSGRDLNREFWLGSREPEVYGSASFDDLAAACRATGRELGLDVQVRQTDDEAELVRWVHAAADARTPVVLNPAAFTHYSYALRDALAMRTAPLVEVH